MNSKNHSSAIYAKTLDGSKELLICHVRLIDGKRCITYEKDGKVLAYKPMEEVIQEVYQMSLAS